jgi:YegS/Rv2252/BmrU family lipid kinase
MKAKKKARRQLKKEFEQAREQYGRLQAKVEKGRAKVEKRAAKLQKLEVNVAKLERRLHLGQGDANEQTKDKNTALRRARLIFKPTEGVNDRGAQQLEEIVTCLRANGILADAVLKTSGKAVRAISKEAAANRDAMVIVAAGDGTIEDVAFQLIGTKTALGVIPIGTMNNLAHAWGIPLNMEDACALLGMGLTREIDVGRVHANEKSDVEYFLETAGIGLTAIAIPAGQAAEKHRWDLLPKALRKLFDSQPTRLSIELDEGPPIEVVSEVVTVSNSPLIGKNILIAPEAKMDDALLEIATYEHMGKTDLLGYFMAVADGKRTQDARVVFHRASRVRLRSDQPVDVHSDKDVIEAQRVIDIEIVPRALRVVVGKGMALTLPVDNMPSVPPLAGTQPAAEGEDKSQGMSRSDGKVHAQDKNDPRPAASETSE